MNNQEIIRGLETIDEYIELLGEEQQTVGGGTIIFRNNLQALTLGIRIIRNMLDDDYAIEDETAITPENCDGNCESCDTLHTKLNEAFSHVPHNRVMPIPGMNPIISDIFKMFDAEMKKKAKADEGKAQ